MVYARANELSEENTHEIAPLLLAANQGCANYIMQNLNPISHEEYPFLIVAMENIIKVLEKEDPYARAVADALLEVLGCKYVAVPTGSVLGDAMRAMNGEVQDSETGE